MSESNSTVVREVLLDQYVTIETSHFGDSENTDTTEGSGSYGKYFTLCNICAQRVVCGRLQTIEGDVSGNNISFQSTLGYLFGKGSCHDHLVLHVAGGQLLGVGVTAMESHEGVIVGIVEFTLDGLFVHIIGNSVVDIQQSYGICADAGSDELT